VALQEPHAAAPDATTYTRVREPASFDARWAAWEAKGAAHDRAVRRKLALAAPVLLVVVAMIVYAFLGR
jgi:hypothetical protein